MIFWLVVYLPLWKIWKSMGRIIPYIMENKIHVWNHQPDMISYSLILRPWFPHFTPRISRSIQAFGMRPRCPAWCCPHQFMATDDITRYKKKCIVSYWWIEIMVYYQNKWFENWRSRKLVGGIPTLWNSQYMEK
jgi:hypothetical protein